MTYEKDYRLANKMQKQFRGRGAEVSGMQASSTSELMRRAEKGSDPRINCAEQAFRENYRSKQSQNPRMSYGANQNAQSRKRAGSYNAQSRTNYSHNRSENKAEKRRERPTREDYGINEPIMPAVEIQVKNKTVSPMFIAILLLGTVMIMCLVLSISEIYQTANEIAQLENELEVLKGEADELKLKLEEKNDVRTIEEIATKKLGMVKEDSLQRRYVSLSDGEYIELVADSNENSESTGGVMLSSIFSSLGRFLERFK